MKGTAHMNSAIQTKLIAMLGSGLAMVSLAGCSGSGESHVETSVTTTYEYTTTDYTTTSNDPEISYEVHYDVYNDFYSESSYLTINWGYTTAYYEVYDSHHDAIFIDDAPRWISPGEIHYSRIYLPYSGDLDLFSSSDLDLEVMVYDHHGFEVGYDYDSGYDLNFDLYQWFPAGQYFIEIENVSPYGGYYEFGAHFWPE
jgi:hypothetical protein